VTDPTTGFQGGNGRRERDESRTKTVVSPGHVPYTCENVPDHGCLGLRCTVDKCSMQKAFDHLEAAMTILDAEGQTAAAAQLDHVMQMVQATITAASGAS
jgi:hypothetical protein